jgi:hypothetical protein
MLLVIPMNKDNFLSKVEWYQIQAKQPRTVPSHGNRAKIWGKEDSGQMRSKRMSVDLLTSVLILQDKNFIL